MPELARAVTNLVDTATKGSPDWALRQAVDAVLQSWDGTSAKDTKEALAAFEKGTAKAEGRAAQVLFLALGALVEAGAPPELAWPSVAKGLPKMLAQATRFAELCIDEADDPIAHSAVEQMGRRVAMKHPKEAAAWAGLPSRCLAAIACLTRSSKLRRAEQKSGELIEAVYALEEAIPEVTFLSQVMKVLDDEKLLVLHPASKRGFRAVIRDICSNVELFVLFTDKMVGDPKKGFIPGKSPDPRAVAVLQRPDEAQKKQPRITTTFEMASYLAVEPDGSLAPDFEDAAEWWVWYEGVPAEIPVFEGHRVIILTDPIMKREHEVQSAFDPLHPAVEITGKVSADEVGALLVRMGKAARAARAKDPRTKERLARKEAMEAMMAQAALAAAQELAASKKKAAASKGASKANAKPKPKAKAKASAKAKPSGAKRGASKPRARR